MPRSPDQTAAALAPPGAIVGKLISLNVGRPREVDFNGNTVRTAIWKDPVEGRRAVHRLNVDGDEQADLAAHGGEHRAVFAYQVESYDYWKRELGRDDLVWGHFGENFTVEGLADDEVCIGDRYRIGDAVFEVTQPRVTCFRVGIRLNDPRMPSLLVAHHRPGFYFRVISEGEVGAGDEIERLQVGPEQVTVAEIDGLLYLPRKSTQLLERTLRIPALSDGWRQSFLSMRDRGSETTPPPAAWSGFVDLKVSAVHRESEAIRSLVLKSIEAQPDVAGSEPGQYLTVRLRPDGSDGPAVIRSYSLSRIPRAGEYRISVKREPGGVGSAFLHDNVHVGDVIEAAAPRGDFLLRDGERPVVLVSAGVGATPVLAMLHALAGARDQREVWWLQGARNSAEHAFTDEVDRLMRQLPDGHRIVWYSKPGRRDRPTAVGRITPDAVAAAGVPADADYYICGPDAFMRSLSAGLAARGTPPDQIAVELFGAASVIAPPGSMQGTHPAPHPPAGPAGSGPAVTFSRSGLTVPWDPDFKNLLDFAEACDVPVSFGCRQGVCHYCESGLFSGSIDYVTPPLEPPGADQVLVCCAQPTSPITLEL